MSPVRLFASCLVVLLVIAGCGTKLTRQVDQAKQKWESQGIAHYRIVMQFYEAFARGLETQRTVTVVNGQVSDSSCLTDRCPAFALVDVYTVEDLFAVARGSSVSVANARELDECLEQIEFDPVYGFPNLISLDCPAIADDEHSIRVVSFEVVK